MVAFGKGGNNTVAPPELPDTYQEPARNPVITRIEHLEGELGWRLNTNQGFGAYALRLAREISALSDELSRLRKMPEYRDFIAAKTRAIADAVEQEKLLAEEAERRRNTLTLPDNLVFKNGTSSSTTSLSQSLKISALKPK